MIVLLIGLIIEAKQSDFCSISTFFFAFVVGVFFLSAMLHPTVKRSLLKRKKLIKILTYTPVPKVRQ